MDEEVSRRRLLAALGTGLSAALAGCSPEARGANVTDGELGTLGPAGEPTGGTGETPPDLDIETPQETEAPPSDSPYTQVYREVVDSVAAVTVDGPQSGSGSAWMYDDSHLVTNEHVVGDADTLAARFRNDGWYTARVVGRDAYSDLAVARVRSAPGDARPLPLVDSEAPVGTEVVAVGNPFGLSGSVSAGIISGNNRSLEAPNNFTIPDAVQTDAAANPGNSGGPLVTLEGRVAGVINSGIRGGDNVGFAISAALVERVVPSLIETGDYEHPFMGIQFREVGPRLAEANNLPVSWGIYVAGTPAGGPADGVLRGTSGSALVDGQQVPTGGDVIVNVDGTVIQTEQDLGTFLALQTRPGDTVEVTVIRDGEKVTVPLTLGSRPEP